MHQLGQLKSDQWPSLFLFPTVVFFLSFPIIIYCITVVKKKNTKNYLKTRPKLSCSLALKKRLLEKLSFASMSAHCKKYNNLKQMKKKQSAHDSQLDPTEISHTQSRNWKWACCQAQTSQSANRTNTDNTGQICQFFNTTLPHNWRSIWK